MTSEEKMVVADDVRHVIAALVNTLDSRKHSLNAMGIAPGLLYRLRNHLIDLSCDLSAHTHHQSTIPEHH